MTSSHSAVLGATRSCLRRDRSLILRAYAAVGVVFVVVATLLVLLALPTWIAQTEGVSASLALSQGLLILGGLAVICSIFLPVYLANRRLTNPGQFARREATYGLFGFLIVLSYYLALVVSAPTDLRGEPPSMISPIVDPFYSLDAIFAPILPAVAVFGLVLYDRWLLRIR